MCIIQSDIMEKILFLQIFSRDFLGKYILSFARQLDVCAAWVGRDSDI